MKRFVLMVVCLLVMASGIYALPLPVAGLLIVPDTLDSVSPGQTIRYPLEVLNYGNGPDVPDITFVPGQSDWIHRLVSKDGISDLADTDGDGIPDLDTLAGFVGGVPGFDTFYLDVTPPYWAIPGSFDSTIVYARSSINDTVYDSATVVTIVRGTFVEEHPEEEGALELHSNFACNTLYLSFGDTSGDDVSISIFDALGRRVLSEIIEEPRAEIDLSHLSQGVYFVSVREGGSQRLRRKVIIR
ncbi:hypothetical protein ES703_01255 [subsurface metagenome]|nr:T9SS type A sorting domain-containing protein [bacterium]